MEVLGGECKVRELQSQELLKVVQFWSSRRWVACYHLSVVYGFKVVLLTCTSLALGLGPLWLSGCAHPCTTTP